MSSITFEWDRAKNASDRRKHRLSFEEGSLVFRDPFHRSFQDRLVDAEERWQTLGLVRGVLLVMVAHTFGENDTQAEVIRIISVRRANSKERSFYENKDR